MARVAGRAPAAKTGGLKPQGLLAQIVAHRADYLYVAPALGLMALVILYPLLYTIYLSFFETSAYSPDLYFVGFENYQELFTHRIFGLVVWNTIYWTVGSTVFSFLLGLGAALLVNQALPGMAVFKALLVVPYVIGHVTASYAWRWLLHGDFGVISATLMSWGWISDPIPFLQSGSLVIPSLILVNTWKSFPFVMIMLLAGLQTIPEDLYKAARVDGAGRWSQFIEITIPQLMPVIAVTTVLLVINNINSFVIPYVMTGGGPAHLSEIIITWIYNISFQTLRFGLGSALSVVLFIVLLSFSMLYVKALTGGQRTSE